jgi:subtilisin family serine protease
MSVRVGLCDAQAARWLGPKAVGAPPCAFYREVRSPREEGEVVTFSHRSQLHRFVVLGVLAILVCALLPAGAAADESFSYDGVTWQTYSLHGQWFMASGLDTFMVRPGRVTAAFDTTLTTEHIEAIIERVPGLSVLRRTRFNTYDFEFSPDVDPGTYAVALREQAGVITAVPDAFCLIPDATPDDTYFDLQWALRNTGQFGGTVDADIDAPECWDLQTGDTTAVIAIIDSGIDSDHPDLWANLWTNWAEATGTPSVDDDGNGFVDDVHGYDFLDSDGDPEHGPTEVSFHGTHIAGIAAAKTNNGVGVSGVAGGWGESRANGCKLMILRIGLNSTNWEFDAVDDAIEYAVDNGADVISMSFHSYYSIVGLTSAVGYAWNNDVLLVAASGNNEDEIYLPASLGKVMAIGATSSHDEVAYYSTGGPELNLTAPGGGQYTPWGMPDTTQIYSTMGAGNYGYKSGTSMATPHVAAAAALARSAEPSITNSDMWAVLEYSVDDTAGTAMEGWENTYGWGRLNVGTMMNAVDYWANSTYTYTTSPCKVFCPAADADSFVISVTIKDGQDAPVEGVPASAIWVESLGKMRICCAEEEDAPDCVMEYPYRLFADGPTDSLGTTTITFKSGGGYDTNTPVRRVRVYGLKPSGAGLLGLFPFRSFDLNKDCVVDASDVAAFDSMRDRQVLAADFDCDSDVDAADSLLLAAHYGHACPGSRGIGESQGTWRSVAALRQNSPNPFNPTTRIDYEIPGDKTHVRIAVYSVAGRLVRTLVDAVEDRGRRAVTWDGRDDAGRQLPSGVYFYRIETPSFSQQRKMVFLK